MTKLYRLSALAVIAMLVVIGSVAPLAMPANAAPAASHSLANNLVAYWKLDEASGTRSDSVGANHLTDNNTVTQNTGKLNYAAQFTAANSEYLSIADNAELSTGDIDFTIAAWVYYDNKSGQPQIVSRASDAAAKYEYYIRHIDSDRLAFSVFKDDTNYAGNVAADNFGSPPLSTWLFVVAWHDSVNNLVGISINNGTPNTSATTGIITDQNLPFAIGSQGEGKNYWNGRIDSVGFFKSAPGGGGVLTQAQRDLLWNNGAGCDFPFDACEATHTPTATNTFTPSSTPTQTFTPSNTPTQTFTPSNTPTITDTPSDTPTITLTPSLTFTPSNTPLVSDTPTITLTPSLTFTPSDTATAGPSPTASATPLPCATANAFESSVVLSSGNCFIVERRWSYGLAFVGVAVIGLAGVFGLRWMYDMVRQWLR